MEEHNRLELLLTRSAEKAPMRIAVDDPGNARLTYGELKEAAPEFAVATVTHRVQGYGGATPYVRWGNSAALVLCLVMIAAAFGIQRYTARSAA